MAVAAALAVLEGYDRGAGARCKRARRMWPEGAIFRFVPVLAPSQAVRDRALRGAAAKGIELRSCFSVPLHRMPAFKSVAVAAPLTNTEALAAQVLSLPMPNDLSEDAIDAIVGRLIAAARSPDEQALAKAAVRPPPHGSR
jgi:dTDP-4-amino-4,6-dideoxygalactose transaminase